jgi:hypothetical protein
MPECECEGQQQSVHSPGIVQAGEGIVYCLVYPVDSSDPVTFVQANEIMPRKFLVAGTLSVARAMHTTRETFQREVVSARTAKEGRKFMGCWSVDCQVLRELLDGQGTRAICVVDAGYETCPGHAHLAFSHALVAAGKNAQQAAKGDMIQAFRLAGELPIEECFAV